MDKFKVIVNIILIACVMTVVISLGIYSMQVHEERVSDCTDICSSKDIVYFNYHMDRQEGTVFCICLNNGIENKFALVEVDE